MMNALDTARPRVHPVRPSPLFVVIVAATGLGVWLCTTERVGAGVATFVLVFAGWILSLVLHEFAHAIVAYGSGDRSVAAKGYLTLDPRRYTDPLTSIALPLFFLIIGGIGLPGGAVWINRAALRSRAAASLVSLAGPAVNLTLAAGCLTLLSSGTVDVATQPVLARAVAFSGFLQVVAFVLNMLPIPGLDGFGALEPFLPSIGAGLPRPGRPVRDPSAVRRPPARPERRLRVLVGCARHRGGVRRRPSARARRVGRFPLLGVIVRYLHRARNRFGRPVHRELRRPFELMALKRSAAWQGEGIPPGNGRPILVISGFMAGRTTSEPLVHVLREAGWTVEAAAVGRNAGPAYDGIDRSTAGLHELAERTGQPVTVIGHSRGGQYARVLAVRHTALVRQVIAVGTPLLVKYPPFVVVNVPATLLERAWRAGWFGQVHPHREDEVDTDRYAAFPPQVDFVSIWSRSDGIVDWRLSREPGAFDIEVATSHLGMIASPRGVAAIATALNRQPTSVRSPGVGGDELEP